MTGPMPRELRKRMPRIKKAAFRLMAAVWHRTMRPKHFTKAGAREYRYDPRQGERAGQGTKRFRRSYTGQKLRRFGHTDPLVLTGESRRATAIRRIKGTSKGARVIMRAPKLNFRTPGRKKTMREELTTISRPEVRRLITVLRKKIKKGIADIRPVRIIRA